MYIADMHCDTIMMLWLAQREGRKLSLRDARNSDQNLQIDLLKLKEGGSLMQNFAIYVNLQMEDGTDPWTQFREMLEIYHSEIAANSDLIREACSYEDIIKNRDAGLISAVMTVEEGGVLEGKLDRLKILHDEGVRMMTLTWNYENELGFPNEIPEAAETDYREYFRFVPRTDNGLKEKGFEAVEIMQELGMIVDVSHLSDAGFYDVAKTLKGPFVASHSNARVFAGCNRNMTDDMIKTVGEHGGVIGLNLCPDFLMEAESEDACKSTIEGIARHARHMINVGGLSAVGIGTDYDGIEITPEGMEDISKLPKIFDELTIKGYTEDEIEKIAGGNFIRVSFQVV